MHYHHVVPINNDGESNEDVGGHPCHTRSHEKPVETKPEKSPSPLCRIG